MGIDKHRKARQAHEARHVRLYHWMLDTPAWASLDCYARAVYVEMAKLYAGAGSNNGKIVLSCRQVGERLNCSRGKAHDAFQQLQSRGFIVATKRGGFNLKNPDDSRATEWRLTEFACDVTHKWATKEFASWRPQKPFHGSPDEPNGSPDEPRGSPDEPKQQKSNTVVHLMNRKAPKRRAAGSPNGRI